MTVYKSPSYATNEATVFLNPLEHDGKKYIRLWYKPNRHISQRLKTADWIKYSKTYKCFVMQHSPQAIEMTYNYFQGLAHVNTRYLNRPERLKPDQRTAVLATKHQCEPLKKLPEMPIVRLQPVQIDRGILISITYKYNRDIYCRLKSSGVARWQKEQQCFAVEPGATNIHTLLSELEGAAWLWLCQELQVKDVALLRTLWEQTYDKSAGYITCPLVYLEKLFLLNYSLSTIRPITACCCAS